MSLEPRFQSGAIHVPAGEGIQRWVAGDTYSIKAVGQQTKGTLGLVEASVPPGAGPIAHIHAVGDEAFYILDGQLEFLDGERVYTAKTGDFIYVPAGIRHRFKNKHVHTARMLFMFTPAGPEEALVEGGDHAIPGVPPPAWDAERFALIDEVARSLNLSTELFPETEG